MKCNTPPASQPPEHRSSARELWYVWQSCCRWCHGIFKAAMTLQVFRHSSMKGDSAPRSHFLWTSMNSILFSSCTRALWPFRKELARTSLVSVKLSAPSMHSSSISSLWHKGHVWIAEKRNEKKEKRKTLFFFVPPIPPTLMEWVIGWGSGCIFCFSYSSPEAWPWKATMKKKPSRPLPDVCSPSLPQSFTSQLPLTPACCCLVTQCQSS